MSLRVPGRYKARRRRGSRRRKRFSQPSPGEALLAWQVSSCGLPLPEREYHAIPGRNYRFDFAWPEHKLLLEVQGAVYAGKRGGHSSGTGITRDCEKATLAAVEGWRYMAVTTQHVKSGEAVGWLMEFFKTHGKGGVNHGRQDAPGESQEVQGR